MNIEIVILIILIAILNAFIVLRLLNQFHILMAENLELKRLIREKSIEEESK